MCRGMATVCEDSGGEALFEGVWRWTGGNPGMLRRLYAAGWRFDVVLGQLVEEKGVDRFVEGLSAKGRGVLVEAVEDLDVFGIVS